MPVRDVLQLLKFHPTNCLGGRDLLMPLQKGVAAVGPQSTESGTAAHFPVAFHSPTYLGDEDFVSFVAAQNCANVC